MKCTSLSALCLPDVGSWLRCGCYVVAGILGALSLSPWSMPLLLLPSFSLFFLLLQTEQTCLQACRMGWLWGLAYFMAGLYWLYIPLLVEPEKLAWLAPVMLVIVPGYFAVFPALAALASFIAFRIFLWPVIRVLLFATFWALAEYGQGHLFTGMPWNLVGYAAVASNALLQSVSLLGIYVLSGVLVLVAAMPALFLLQKRGWALNILMLGVLGGLIVWGNMRLNAMPTDYSSVKIRVVQANIPQFSQLTPALQIGMLKKYAELTKQPGWQDINVIVWPESAVPLSLPAKGALARELGALVPSNRASLVFGAMRTEKSLPRWKTWNSLFVLNQEGEVISYYDKHHLVPFGEYIPWRPLLTMLITPAGYGDYMEGDGDNHFFVPGAPQVLPLICFESIFPEYSMNSGGDAEWLLNVSNDAWFGISAEPYQHFEMARVRAVEQGLPMVLSNNPGVSGIVDPAGRVLKFLPLNSEGVVDAYLPRPAGSVYARYPNLSWRLMMVLVATLCGLSYYCQGRYRT